MRLVLTVLTRDEEDIIAANLEFHLSQGVDFIIATDNGSVDGTIDILRDYERAGVLHLIHEPGNDFSQGVWVTRMARLADIEYGADWVINSDADEFWWPRVGTLLTCLEGVPGNIDAIVARRHNFLRLPSHPGSFFEQLILRHVTSTNALGEPLPPKICHRARPDAIVHQGNHTVEWLGKKGSLDDDRIEILHCPIRTYEQFENKILKGGQAYQRNTQPGPVYGHVWRKLLKRHQAGEFPAVYRELVPDDREIERGLRDGRWVPDYRLNRYLDRIKKSTVVSDALST